MVDQQTIQGVQVLATLVSGPTAGWVVAHFLLKRLDKKDDQHLSALESHITTLQNEAKQCHENYLVLLKELLELKSLHRGS